MILTASYTTRWDTIRASRGSVQLMVLGIFGEYLGRMYMEGKRRPLFIVNEIAANHPVAPARTHEDHARPSRLRGAIGA